MVPVLLGPQKRLDQICVVDATTEPMTIRYPHTDVISEDMSNFVECVVTILDVEPNRFILDWLVAALAIPPYPHFGSDTNLWHVHLLFQCVSLQHLRNGNSPLIHWA